jgi:circadian clock protein KaiC
VIEKLSTGVAGLDLILSGGFQKGSAYIVQGPPGAGKTILANQFCYSHVQSGGRSLYVSLLAESHDKMLAFISGMSFYNPTSVPEALQYVSGFGVLEREGLPGLLKLMQHEIKRHRASAVILDGVFIANSNVSEADFRKFVHELQGVANFSEAVLVMLTHEARSARSPEHTMVDGWIEIRDELKGFRAYRTVQVKKHRGSKILSGQHQFEITDSGVSVFPRIEMTVKQGPSVAAPTQRVATGVPDIDNMLGGGLTEGSATLVMGPAGSGKTTMGLHFLAQATPSEPAIMLGFYETPARLGRKAAGIGLNLDEAIASGAVEVMWRPPSENLVDELAWELVERVKAKGAKRILIDGVSALRDNLIAPERLPFVLNALSSHVSAQGATILYTHETRDLHRPDLMPTDELSGIVDNILTLTYLREEDALRRTVAILKLRDSDFDPRSREFHVDGQGIVFGPHPRLIASGA